MYFNLGVVHYETERLREIRRQYEEIENQLFRIQTEIRTLEQTSHTEKSAADNISRFMSRMDGEREKLTILIRLSAYMCDQCERAEEAILRRMTEEDLYRAEKVQMIINQIPEESLIQIDE